MEYLIAAGISLLAAIVIAIPWVRAIEKLALNKRSGR